MSRVQIVLLTVLLAALAAMGGAMWWLSRDDGVPNLTPPPDPDLPYVLTVPREPELGCPAYAVRVPVEPPPVPEAMFGSRQDTTLNLGDGAAILVVCLGPVGPAEEIVADHVAGRTEGLTAVAGPGRSSTRFGEAVTWTGALGRKLLSEWYVDRDGVVVVVGALSAQDGPSLDPIVERMLATWTWD